MRRVAKAGFGADFLKAAVFPDWWSSSCASDSALLTDIEFRLARFLGTSIEQLRLPSASVSAPVYPGAQLRRVKNIDADRLGPAIHAGLRISAAALRALRDPAVAVRLPPSDPLEWRHQLIRERAPHTLTLVDQVSDLWTRGIPVLHIDVLPSPKYQALAGIIDGRPVIVLAYRSDELPRLEYHLVHEVGHLVLGHCNEDEPVVDEEESIQDSSSFESQADSYARAFVSDGHDFSRLRSLSFRELAREASDLSLTLRAVDAGTIIWDWSVQTGDFRTGQMALRALYRNHGARRILREQFDAHVDLEKASESDRALLRCIAGDPDRNAVAG
jgi:hypothetical protein